MILSELPFRSGRIDLIDRWWNRVGAIAVLAFLIAAIIWMSVIENEEHAISLVVAFFGALAAGVEARAAFRRRVVVSATDFEITWTFGRTLSVPASEVSVELRRRKLSLWSFAVFRMGQRKFIVPGYYSGFARLQKIYEIGGGCSGGE